MLAVAALLLLPVLLGATALLPKLGLSPQLSEWVGWSLPVLLGALAALTADFTKPSVWESTVIEARRASYSLTDSYPKT